MQRGHGARACKCTPTKAILQKMPAPAPTSRLLTKSTVGAGFATKAPLTDKRLRSTFTGAISTAISSGAYSAEVSVLQETKGNAFISEYHLAEVDVLSEFVRRLKVTVDGMGTSTRFRQGINLTGTTNVAPYVLPEGSLAGD